MIEELSIQTTKRCELFDITSKVQEIVSKNKIPEGICIIFVPHTTAGITIQENSDPDVVEDFLMHLSKLVPENSGFKHAEGNSAAHIKAGIVGSSVIVPIENSKLLLGTWQAVYFCEFDGARKRKAIVQVFSK
jgi:secondary thiamine-phosphate synthase enzyme